MSLSYYNYESSFVTETTVGTILAQDLVEHFGMYGTRYYDYRNLVIFKNNSTGIIDSIDLMAHYRPKDIIYISTTYQRQDDGSLKVKNIRYNKIKVD